MVNPRLLKVAGRWKDPEVPAERTSDPPQKQPVSTAGIPNFEYFFLGGDLGRETHEAIVRKYGAENKFVTANVNYDSGNGIVKGSKPGYIVAANEFLRGRNLRTANSYDLQKVIDQGKLATEDCYEDLGLVLYSEDGENEYLARDVASQLRKRGRLVFPVTLPLSGLELRADKSAPDGMVFNVTDRTQIIRAPKLAHDNDGKKFSKVDKNGIPIFSDDGKYTLYTGGSGLRVLIRDRSSILNARYRGLVSSSEGGRVVVCREATQKNLGGKRK